MAGRPADMEGWGVYSIFKEAGKLLYRHLRILRPFILAFLLPLALTVFLEVIGVAWILTWLTEHVLPLHLEGIFGHHHRHSGFRAFHAAFFKAPISLDPILELLIVIYAVIFLIATFNWILESLATAAIAKAIHHIYSSNNTSHNEDDNSSDTDALIQSIFTSLPHSFYRIFIISLCFLVVNISAYFFLAPPFYLLSRNQFYPHFIVTFYTWLCNLVFLILDFWFKVSVQVAVLESHYGWAVLQRSAKLVKTKKMTALGLLVIYFVYFYVFSWILQVAMMISAHSVTLYVLAGALAFGFLAFAAFWLVVVTMFYFVCKCKCEGGEEGRQVEGDLYQALDVSVEN